MLYSPNIHAEKQLDWKVNSVIYRFNDNRDSCLFLLYVQYVLNIVIVYISSKANNVADLSLFFFSVYLVKIILP